MTARVYTLPSTSDERAHLVAEITRMCSQVLRYPARQANVERWNELPIVQLRMCYEKWVKTWEAIGVRRDFTAGGKLF